MRGVTVVLLANFVLLPSLAFAQDQAGIAGTVQDETGGFLPGVIAEARSPAMIEQVRTVTTDFAGNYRVTNLPPGTYSVTFILAGFNTSVHEGVVLQGAFVASLDAQMLVGTLQETVTVTAATSAVDVTSVKQQTVMPADKIHVLPGFSNLLSGNAYVPGVVNAAAYCNMNGVLHGSDNADSQPFLDGIKSGKGLGGRSDFNGGINQGTSEAAIQQGTSEAAIQELVYDTSSTGAEYAQSGVRSNLIPKSGGNTFAGEFYATGTRGAFYSDNLNDELRAQGFEFAPVAWNYNLNPAFGGPIVEDKLWFFATGNYGQNKTYHLGYFFSENDPTTPEGIGEDRRVFQDGSSGQIQTRITHQMTPRNKMTHYFVTHRHFYNRVVPGGQPVTIQSEALLWGDNNPAYLYTGRWTAPLTNRLLFELAGSFERMTQHIGPDGAVENSAPFRDLARGVDSGKSFITLVDEGYRRELQGSVSYVTGSHNFKAGLVYRNNVRYFSWPATGDIFQAWTLNGNPYAMLIQANPSFPSPLQMNCDCGMFVQDAWTRDRLTLNLGLRYDYFRNSVPAGTRPAGFFSPAFEFDGIDNIPKWTDWSPRAGVAFDLFGDGTTALKASVGRYVAHEAVGVTDTFSPIGPFGGIDFRLWSDLNGDGTMLDADGTPQLNEIAASFNPNYGLPGELANRWDPNTERGKNWEYSAGIERQLSDGWSMSGMWHRRRFYDFRRVDNQFLSASDYVPVSFTAPTDPRLPNGGGEQVTVYGLAPGFNFQTGDLLHTQAPDNYRTWNGFEVIVDGELPRGGFMTASWTAGETVNHFCDGGLLENPNGLRFCHNESPYRHIAKLSGVLPLPFDTMISGLFQVFQGGPVAANYTVAAGDVGPGALVTNGSPSTVGINLIEPGTLFYDPTWTLLLRFAKVFNMGDSRTRVYMDANNIFNRTALTRFNEFFGGDGVVSDVYQRPLSVQRGRALSFGMRMFF